MTDAHQGSFQIIRNFSIVAHIDHGKSTLADRLIQMTGSLEEREMKEQVLDTMDIERERGITIKANTVRLEYDARDGEHYVLNLIDTPGHVDFAYEVSRSLRACEGSLLVVDASPGRRGADAGQCLPGHRRRPRDRPVLNKADLPAAEPERVKEQIEEVIGLDASDALLISAKTGQGVDEVLEAIVTPAAAQGRRPHRAAQGHAGRLAGTTPISASSCSCASSKASMKKGQTIRMMGTDAKYPVDRVGVLTPKLVVVPELGPGEIGVFTASIKEVADTRVGDTITEDKRPTENMLPGFKPAQPVVFCGLFPVDAADFEDLRAAIGKLRLNDASFSYEMETGRARLRLPLRLPRPAAPGDHPGAPEPRIRSRPDRHRAVGRLPHDHDRRLE
jgi:GTP-binding protein LepA